MKILWLCNIVLPRFAKKLNEPKRNTGGWLTGILGALESTPNTEIAIAFPTSKDINDVVDGIRCFGFCNPSVDLFEKYIKDFQPDIIHVFGTESFHSNCMLKAAKNTGVLEHTVVSIQGLIYIYAKHYTGYMIEKYVKGTSLKDLITGNIARQQKKFFQRGEIEKETIQMAKHIIGRTEWDKACVRRINMEAEYHFCNEILRPFFYEKAGSWDIDQCERHSIFVSQYGYPIKGFHLMLEALEDIVKEYPDCKLYTTGNDLFHLSSKEKLIESAYNKYLRKIIINKHLVNNVVFLGSLSEEEMCNQFLRSNVFVCCSSIENSPNSLGEAMLLGTPCVTSDVGGVKDMLRDKEEGYIYPADEPYMCAYYIMKIFNDDAITKRFSVNASNHAQKTHSVDVNNRTLLSIYNSIR